VLFDTLKDRRSSLCSLFEYVPSSDPQRGIGFMPKRGLNVNICEIARLDSLIKMLYKFLFLIV